MIGDKSSFFMLTIDEGEELCPVPFEGIPDGPSGDAARRALEASRTVSVAASSQEHRRNAGADTTETQDSGRCGAVPPSSRGRGAAGNNTRGRGERSVPQTTDRRDNRHRHDDVLDNIYSAAISTHHTCWTCHAVAYAPSRSLVCAPLDLRRGQRSIYRAIAVHCEHPPYLPEGFSS